MTNKKTYFVLLVTMLFWINSYTQSNKLIVAFIKISSIYKGVQVYVNGLPIGKVFDIIPAKNLDTLFVVLKITDKVRIPKGSQFYLDEGLLGSPLIKVELSKEDTYLTSKDISIGTFRSFPTMSPAQLDSAKQKQKSRLRSPKVDSVKN